MVVWLNIEKYKFKKNVMNIKTQNEIAELIKLKINDKLKNYASETTATPFFSAIFDRETIFMASVMQSLYTSFGMSIYEQMGVILARSNKWTAERQYSLLGQIDQKTENLISDLCTSPTPNKHLEIEQIRKSIKPGVRFVDPEGIVDVYVKKPDGTELYVDITTVKPNLKEFRSMRRKMLRWCALRMSINKNVKIDTRIGIPYNPYYPEPYDRWTGGECDPKGDLLVERELWSAFAGKDVFHEILEIFRGVGVEMRDDIRKFIIKAGQR